MKFWYLLKFSAEITSAKMTSCGFKTITIEPSASTPYTSPAPLRNPHNCKHGFRQRAAAHLRERNCHFQKECVRSGPSGSAFALTGPRAHQRIQSGHVFL